MKKNIFKIFKFLNKFFYKKKYIEEYKLNEFYNIFKIGFIQRIIGFNRYVAWPVHWSTTVLASENIIPGNRSPGGAMYCHIDGRNGILFGKNVRIGPHVMIVSMNHNLYDYSKYLSSKPITIGDNCWIGAGAIILPGVNLGHHTVVSAGSIVNKSFEGNNQVIGGNPAKFIQKLPEYLLNHE